jgi:hypothetical protein
MYGEYRLYTLNGKTFEGLFIMPGTFQMQVCIDTVTLTISVPTLKDPAYVKCVYS